MYFEDRGPFQGLTDGAAPHYRSEIIINLMKSVKGMGCARQDDLPQARGEKVGHDRHSPHGRLSNGVISIDSRAPCITELSTRGNTGHDVARGRVRGAGFGIRHRRHEYNTLKKLDHARAHIIRRTYELFQIGECELMSSSDFLLKMQAGRADNRVKAQLIHANSSNDLSIDHMPT